LGAAGVVSCADRSRPSLTPPKPRVNALLADAGEQGVDRLSSDLTEPDLGARAPQIATRAAITAVTVEYSVHHSRSSGVAGR
jgi:hypothetical protein